MKEPGYKLIPGLDDCIHNLLDWLDGSAMGLGEVIDRLRHLSACRAYSGRYLDDVPAARRPRTGTRETRSTYDPAQIVRLRAEGNGIREIADMLGCSVGTVSKHFNPIAPTTRREHIETCGKRKFREGKC
ncbi:MAG: helix-turn-helix domain-containing protein [Planctomycetaceae bacterium]|nr:helix-turn-helix domain-containing protein [Planctomycetaceae bacterium]